MKSLAKKAVSLLALVCVLTCVAVIPQSAVASPAATGSSPTVYSTFDKYKYQLSEPFERSPDTMMAWVRMPEYSVGGSIVGNLKGTTVQNDGTAVWNVDALGRIGLQWNKAFFHRFSHEGINDGEWHHVTVSRDPEAHVFTLYIDGVKADEVACRQPDLLPAMLPMIFGVTNETSAHNVFQFVKTPFEGDIRQVTFYNGAVDAARVVSDMQATAPVDDYDGALMGSWYLGEQWTERTVADGAGSDNAAILMTYDKYVADTTDGYEYDYAFIVFPDTQDAVHHQQADLNTALQWIADNTEEKKFKFLLQAGDLVDEGENLAMYYDTAAAFDRLNNILPYSFVQGNHDYDDSCHSGRLSNNFKTAFPYAKHKSLPGFGGVYEIGSMENSYYLYEIGAVKYCVINLELSPRMDVLRWAGRVCEQYPDHRIIFNTHCYLDETGGIMDTFNSGSASNYNWKSYTDVSSSQEMFDNLISQYQNVFMVFCGHVISDDVMVRTDVGVHGNTVTSMLVDGQGSVCDDGIGEDMFLICMVNETTKKMCCTYYSPTHDGAYNLQNMFELSFADALNPTVGA